MTHDDLAAQAARLIATTPGEWQWSLMDGHRLCLHVKRHLEQVFPPTSRAVESVEVEDIIGVQSCRAHDACLVMTEADADFIAHAPDDLRACHAALRQAWGELETLRALLKKHGHEDRCNWWGYGIDAGGVKEHLPCDCGLNQALTPTPPKGV